MLDVKDLGTSISELDDQANNLLEQRDAIRMSIPNLLHDAVPVGADEEGNTVHSIHGSKKEYDFDVRTHNELIEMNNWVELERAAKIAGSRFFFLKGDLARLEFALQPIDRPCRSNEKNWHQRHTSFNGQGTPTGNKGRQTIQPLARTAPE